MPLFPNPPSADQSLVQARRTTTFALSSSFADVGLDTTDIQNDTTAVEHTSADQVTIKVAGKYGITYAGTAPAGAYTTSFQVRKNDTSVLPGSERSAVSIGSDGESITGSFIADLVTGDFITLQAKVDSGTPNLAAGMTLTVVHMAGQKGDPGEASATDVDAVHVNVGAEISLIAEKTTPASDDLLIIEDSAASNIKKRLKIGNLPGGVSLSDTAPVNVTKAAASAGAGTGASRNDHKHDVTTDTPAAGAVAVGNTADEGASTSLSRADHKHSVAKGTPVDVGTANAAGAGTDFAAGNHVHAGLTRGAADFNSFSAKGTPAASDLLLIEDSAAANAKKKITVSSLGIAPLSSTAPVDVTKAAANAGAATESAKQDHKHDVSTAAAVELTDSTNAEGAATSLARSNHTHAHGNRGGGTLHPAATGAVNGFMTAADKTKLDTVLAGARPAIMVSMGDSNGPGVNVGSQTPTIVRYAIYRGTGSWTPNSFKVVAQCSNANTGYCDIYDVTNGKVLATLSFSGNTVQIVSGSTFANLPIGEAIIAFRAYRGSSSTTVTIFFAIMASN